MNRASAPGAPCRLPRPVGRDWDDLATPTRDSRPFDPGVLDGLPAPVIRWVRQAIAPGTPLQRSVRLTMHGEIRVGRWRPCGCRGGATRTVATFAEHPFGGELGGEATYEGYTIPTTLRVGWGYGTDAWPNGVFFRAVIETARYR